MRKIIFASLLSDMILQGCISFSSFTHDRPADGTGETTEYDAPKAEVWQKTLTVIQNTGLRKTSENYDLGWILAQQPFSLLEMTTGQNITIYISESTGRTHVKVINKSQIGEMAFSSHDWEHHITDELAHLLNQP